MRHKDEDRQPNFFLLRLFIRNKQSLVCITSVRAEGGAGQAGMTMAKYLPDQPMKLPTFSFAISSLKISSPLPFTSAANNLSSLRFFLQFLFFQL
jgi:hypothetical protein